MFLATTQSKRADMSEDEVTKKKIDKTQRENQIFFGFLMKMRCAVLCACASVSRATTMPNRKHHVLRSSFFPFLVGRRCACCACVPSVRKMKKRERKCAVWGKANRPIQPQRSWRCIENIINFEYRSIDLAPYGRRYTDRATANIVVIFISFIRNQSASLDANSPIEWICGADFHL